MRKKLDFLELANIIDAQVAKQMATEGIKPSARRRTPSSCGAFISIWWA